MTHFVPSDQKISTSSNKALSIVVCTYNRASQLKILLRDLIEQRTNLEQEDDIEIIVVDNNSSDETAELLSKQSGIVYLREEQQGSSFARNTGVKAASGHLIAFIDDDIRLNSKWLAEVYKLAITKPVLVAYGGKVTPDWEAELPPWLNLEAPFEIMQAIFPSHNYGDREHRYPFYFGNRKILNPICANLMVTRDIFAELGLFRTDLGLHGRQRGACEDTELCWRILAKAYPVKYFPKANVYHPVGLDRLNKSFVTNWYYVLGRTLLWMRLQGLNHLEADLRTNRFCETIKTLLKLLAYSAAWLLTIFDRRPHVHFWFTCKIYKCLGELRVY